MTTGGKELCRLWGFWLCLVASHFITMVDAEVSASSSSSSGTCHDVALVMGAGPAGLVTALGLSQVCRKVFLVEKHKTFEPRGATIAIHPNGKKALLEICPEVWTSMEEVGVLTPHGGMMLPWWEMRDAAVKAVRKRENIELCTGEIFSTIEDSEEGVHVKFKSGLELTADFLVAADGVHSAVRQWLKLPKALPAKNSIWRGYVNVTEHCSEELKSLLGKGLVPFMRHYDDGTGILVINFHEKRPGRMTWAVSTTRKASDSTLPLEMFRGSDVTPEERKLLEEIFSISPKETLKPFPPSNVMDLSEAVLAKYNGGWGGKGRIALVGDAAHSMRATDGQGANQAFEDAVVLYRTMRSHRPDHSVEETLRQFEAARLPRVKKIHDEQRIKYEGWLKGDKVVPLTEGGKHWVWEGV